MPVGRLPMRPDYSARSGMDASDKSDGTGLSQPGSMHIRISSWSELAETFWLWGLGLSPSIVFHSFACRIE
jgi:hypothetical protein